MTILRKAVSQAFLESQRAARQSISRALPETPNSFTFKSGETEITVYGIIHSMMPRPTRNYRAMVNSIVEKHDLVLAEDGLGRIFGLPDTVKEVSDRSVMDNKNWFKEAMIIGLTIPLQIASMTKYALFTRWKEERENANMPLKFQGGENIPIGWEAEIENHDPSSMSDYYARSMYHLAVASQLKGVRSVGILEGAMHAAHIQEFVCSGRQLSSEMIQIGSEHARLLQGTAADTKEFEKTSMQTQLKMGAIGFTGIMLGASPYIAGLYWVVHEYSDVLIKLLQHSVFRN